MLCVVFATVTGFVSAAVADLSGSIVIAGNGSELPTIERLARAFKKNHHGSVVEIQWDQYQDPIAMVKSGDADIAVTGRPRFSSERS